MALTSNSYVFPGMTNTFRSTVYTKKLVFLVRRRLYRAS